MPFATPSKVLHWLMAAMVLAMLLIGVGMASSFSERYHLLVSIHKPLGIAILILVILRLINRMINPPPPLPTALPSILKLAAGASHVLLYALLFVMPLIGWAMLSASPYPIILFGALHLPPILPKSPALYGILRPLHTYLAYLLFATFLLHLAAALMHALIFRDGVFESMASWAPGRRTRSGT
jgi:cytochrome b561